MSCAAWCAATYADRVPTSIIASQSDSGVSQNGTFGSMCAGTRNALFTTTSRCPSSRVIRVNSASTSLVDRVVAAHRDGSAAFAFDLGDRCAEAARKPAGVVVHGSRRHVHGRARGGEGERAALPDAAARARDEGNGSRQRAHAAPDRITGGWFRAGRARRRRSQPGGRRRPPSAPRGRRARAFVASGKACGLSPMPMRTPPPRSSAARASSSTAAGSVIP